MTDDRGGSVRDRVRRLKNLGESSKTLESGVTPVTRRVERRLLVLGSWSSSTYWSDRSVYVPTSKRTHIFIVPTGTGGVVLEWTQGQFD